MVFTVFNFIFLDLSTIFLSIFSLSLVVTHYKVWFLGLNISALFFIIELYIPEPVNAKLTAWLKLIHFFLSGLIFIAHQSWLAFLRVLLGLLLTSVLITGALTGSMFSNSHSWTSFRYDIFSCLSSCPFWLLWALSPAVWLVHVWLVIFFSNLGSSALFLTNCLWTLVNWYEIVYEERYLLLLSQLSCSYQLASRDCYESIDLVFFIQLLIQSFQFQFVSLI